MNLTEMNLSEEIANLSESLNSDCDKKKIEFHKTNVELKAIELKNDLKRLANDDDMTKEELQNALNQLINNEFGNLCDQEC